MRAITFLVCLALVCTSWGAAVIEVRPGDTLVRAIDQARAARGPTTQPIRIILHGGSYLMTEPLILSPKESNTTWEAAAGETPVVSGGRRIEHWRKADLNGRACWAADVVGVKEGKWFFRELWIDGTRATRARQPNRGHYLHVKESPDATADWSVGQNRFRFDGSDVPAGPFPYGAEAIVMTRWDESRMPIKAVDAAQHLATFARKSQWRIEPNDSYWLEGDPRWLDEPGEFFLDRTSGTLYYFPLPGQEMGKIEAIAPVLTQLVELRGSPDQKKFLENVTFRGITFAHTQWMLPDPDPATTQPISGGFTQSAIPVPAAVSGQALRNVAFENCTFRNLGTWGLELGRASQQCRVSRCTFRDLGAGGIKLGDDSIHQGGNEQTFANQIVDCEIQCAGHVYPSAVGIWLGQAFDNIITHNHIHDLYYSGISAGWTWGYGDSLNRGNIIEHNHIHHIGSPSSPQATPARSAPSVEEPILADMGAIYLLGGRLGTIVRNNVLHDINGVRIAWGVYLDEGCCDVRVENNLIYRTSHGAFHLHYGRENVVRNNIMALGRELQVWRTREEEHHSFTFERNLVYWTNGPLTKTSPKNVTFDRNVYSGIKESDFRAGPLTWNQWRAAGEDGNSILVDAPIFVEAEKGDFRIKDESIAKRAKFVPFGWNDAGPRDNHGR